MRVVKFCGHILSEEQRRPAPEKLMPIQRWELPKVVTYLRGFFRLTNHYSEYIPCYAELPAPMQDLLKLDLVAGKKGSQFRLTWSDEQVESFRKV